MTIATSLEDTYSDILTSKDGTSMAEPKKKWLKEGLETQADMGVWCVLRAWRVSANLSAWARI